MSGNNVFDKFHGAAPLVWSFLSDLDVINAAVTSRSSWPLVAGYVVKQPMNIATAQTLYGGKLPAPQLSRFIINDSSELARLPSSTTELSFVCVGIQPRWDVHAHPEFDIHEYPHIGIPPRYKFPSSLARITFDDTFRSSLRRDMFPATLQSLIFSQCPNTSNEHWYKSFDKPLQADMFPALTELQLGDHWSRELTSDTFPQSLLRLSFGAGFFGQRLRMGVLPLSLTDLRLHKAYHQTIDAGLLPASITHLELGNSFNSGAMPSIRPRLSASASTSFSTDQSGIYTEPAIIPRNVRTLVIGPVNTLPPFHGQLPPSLTQLTLILNRLLDFIDPGSLPDALTHLQFGENYDLPLVARALPPSLTQLSLGYRFNHSVEVGILPDSLSTLTFSDWFDQPLSIGSLPTNLTHLTFGFRYNEIITVGILPPSLRRLEFGVKFNQFLDVGVLPASITHLEFHHDFQQQIPIGVLPSSLQHLVLGELFDVPLIPGSLPPSLTYLKLGREYNAPFEPGLLPSSLTHLILGYRFNQPLRPRVLPNSLLTLALGVLFNQPIQVGVLPPSLLRLTFSAEYDDGEDTMYSHPFEAGVLPSSLTHLLLCPSYPCKVDPHVLPNSLRLLHLGAQEEFDVNVKPWIRVRMTVSTDDNEYDE